MCQFASFVLTKDRVFWSDETDSHESIIEQNKLHADGATGPNILRVEITPPRDGDWGDLSRWNYKVDQDTLPEWAAGAEDRARIALAQRFAKKFTVGGSLYLSGCTGLKALPDNLKVGGSLYLSGCTGLKALPDNLKVGGSLSLPKHLKK
jgi:hypothetical protein